VVRARTISLLTTPLLGGELVDDRERLRDPLRRVDDHGQHRHPAADPRALFADSGPLKSREVSGRGAVASDTTRREIDPTVDRGSRWPRPI